MSADSEVQSPAKFREIAETLREIARRVQYDLCRVDQLHALAAGFDRLANRMDRNAMTAAETADGGWNDRRSPGRSSTKGTISRNAGL